ncbi:uncharacterized protein LOC108671081 [Hyalella azteca]|uniref:Uncharacterized protein LOC108671081 n=1 Tax=Hyalella azteca TaxID=294128 RepID=A0A8B7NK69_HYAAZ|nr:uncharacterized protein LOC108671081 [Hyalella azteca]
MESNRPWWARCDVRYTALIVPLSFILIVLGIVANKHAGDPHYKYPVGLLVSIIITTAFVIVLLTFCVIKCLYSHFVWSNHDRHNATGSSIELQPINLAPSASCSNAVRQRGSQQELADGNACNNVAQRPPSYEDLESMARSTNDTSFLSCQAAALEREAQAQPQQQVVNRTGGNTVSPSTAANETEVETLSGNVSGLCSARDEASGDERLAPSSTRDEASGDERLAPSSTRDEAIGDERLAPSSTRDGASGDERLAPSSNRDGASGDERLASSSNRDGASGDERLASYSTQRSEETKFY